MKLIPVFLALFILTGCVPMSYKDVPTVRAASAIAKARTPLAALTKIYATDCPQQSAWILWGNDQSGRPLIAVVGPSLTGYSYVDGVTWDEALDRVKTTNIQPLDQLPMVSLAQPHYWLVLGKDANGNTHQLEVDSTTGEVKPVPVEMEVNYCKTQEFSQPAGRP